MKDKRLLILLFVAIFVVTLFVALRRSEPVVPKVAATQMVITLADLKNYDGTDATKPVYIAYEGNIYDVTEGRKWYQPDGSYHWLTGKDATTDLNLVGGDIIKRKYPIVGKLIQ
jgi:predicted heme/steroid binding protein